MNDCKNGDCGCGCCEGTEVLTPQSVANRPGLEALSYRTGTHAAFLESMKARLSSKDYPALRALTTRQEDDPAIAMLDAGATMLDVLTFYQERISNEGYLRTATERRSVLELARLVGYKLRPGVAASVYLAFTLENGYPTEIPAGTRAQSIPAPGELPQAFETSEPLQARAEWNELKPRMTRPQSINPIVDTTTDDTTTDDIKIKNVDTNIVYFEGTATNLKPNDPLLFVFVTDRTEVPFFCKIKSVEPQLAENRTKVTLQQKLPADGGSSEEPPPQPGMRAVTDSTAIVDEIQSVLKRHLDLTAFNVSSTSSNAQTVVGLLERLSNALEREMPLEDLINVLDEILRQLRELYKLFKERKWTNLADWVDAFIVALEAIRSSLPTDNPDSDSTDETDDSGSFDPPGDSSIEKKKSIFGKSDSFLDQLSKRPSLQPANAKRLTRSAKTLYGAKADILPRFLAAFNPKLKDVLYKAWANVRVRKEPTQSDPILKSVYALRVKAAPFGYNAPLRPDYFDPAKKIIVYGEWEINNPLNQDVPLDADFIAYPQTGVAPLTVQFVDQSKGYATKWDWDFDDDSNNSPAQDPQHTFNNPGSYNVSLSVGNTSESDTVKKIVIATQAVPISAAFTADPVRGEARLEVQFTDHSTGEIEKWEWEFGDGGKSSEQNPSYIFNRPGTFTVKLTIRGPDGESTTESIILVESGPIIFLTSAQRSEMMPSTEARLVPPLHRPYFIYLDSDYDILPGSWVVIEPGLNHPTIVNLGENAITQRSLAAYGLTGKTTGLNLGDQRKWFNDALSEPFSTVRGTTVYAQSEELALAEEPILTDDSSADEVKLKSVEGKEIVLDALYKGLASGRWAIVSGERIDIKDEIGNSIPGVFDSELVMLASIEQGSDQELPGDTPHTTIQFANDGLAYAYKRDTVKIYGNVVKATHGETRNEVLGSGDGSKVLQTFALKQSPLTYTSAPSMSGIESSLEVRVNDVRWPEVDGLVWLTENARGYITKTDNEDKASIIFGDGKHGVRLPTGLENVNAVYRSGIGKPGNVAAKQISLLAIKPLGVKSVINPLPATGGADRENRDQARRNVPLAVMALDRLVSVQDYADFARTFAGIGKASAVELPDGRRMLVHVTIAGAEDIPIDTTSDLFLNLRGALRQFGDPYQPLQVSVRELMLLVISANIRILPDYQWESVEPRIRAALLDAFSFARRELGQDVMLSEVISVIQGVPGVAYVDVDIFDSVPETIQPEELENLAETFEGPEQPNPRVPVTFAWVDSHADTLEERIRAAQLAYLSPEIPETIILAEKAS